MTLREIVLDNLARIKATDILDYDMRGFSPFYDEMIIASVDSERQASAIIGYLKDDTLKEGLEIRGIEGEGTSWVLVDLNDIIVSVFTKEERERLALEKIYLERPCKKITF